MQRSSLLGRLGATWSFSSKLSPSSFGPTMPAYTVVEPTAPAPTIDPDAPAPGACTADGQFIWDAGGFWRRLKVGETCVAIGSEQVNVRDQRSTCDPTVSANCMIDSIGGGISGEAMFTPSDQFRSGGEDVITIGPFKFSATTTTGAYVWWGKKLPREWQEHILHAWQSPSTTSSFVMTPAIAAYFDDPPAQYPVNFMGSTTRDKVTRDMLTKPTWNPFVRTTHPNTGKDYGVFVLAVYDRGDVPLNDPALGSRLYFIWAPISKSTLGAVWDWIKSIPSKIVGYVCDAVTDPAKTAAVAAASAAGGPVAVAGYGTATLLCQPKPDETPTPEIPPAVTAPKTFPWGPVIAGAIAVTGLVAFLLTPPKTKKKQAPARP